MSGRWCWLPAVVIGLGASELAAQAVQLPVFHTFSTSTTVVVPDNGGMFIAGGGSGAYGASQFGGPFNSGIGSMTSGGGVGAIAQIHDLRAMDAQLLGQQNAGPPDPWTAKVTSARQNMTATPTDSIAEIRKQLAQHDAAQQAEWLASFERGKRAVDEGKPGVAKIYFQSVAKNATGKLKEQAQIELHSLATHPAPPPAPKKR